MANSLVQTSASSFATTWKGPFKTLIVTPHAWTTGQPQPLDDQCYEWVQLTLDFDGIQHLRWVLLPLDMASAIEPGYRRVVIEATDNTLEPVEIDLGNQYAGAEWYRLIKR